jgi:predicted RecA/RadA family phage recombinase
MPDLLRQSSTRIVTAASNLLSGDIVLTSDGFAGIVEAQRGILNGETGNVAISGVVIVTKTTASDVIAAGARIAYNTSTKTCAALPFGAPVSGSIVIGLAAAASGNAVPTVQVDLNAQGPTPEVFGLVKQRRVRATIAEINAGLTVLPAIAGYRYRLVDAKMIAIGGAVTTATAVQINATQSASGVALLSVAVAALTQSAVVRAGAANATVLADGASFNQCDTNTAITVSKTGSNITVATHVDFLIDYTVELP